MSRKGLEKYSKTCSDHFDFEDMNGLTIDEMCEELQKIKKEFLGKEVGNILVENITLRCEHRDCTPEWVLWGIDQKEKKAANHSSA